MRDARFNSCQSNVRLMPRQRTLPYSVLLSSWRHLEKVRYLPSPTVELEISGDGQIPLGTHVGVQEHQLACIRAPDRAVHQQLV